MPVSIPKFMNKPGYTFSLYELIIKQKKQTRRFQ